MKFVSIMMGRKSDYEFMAKTARVLEKFGVLHELVITSAYRNPERTKKYVLEAERRGAKVFIVAAGMETYLAGAVVSLTTKPVIGVPMKGCAMDGLDAMLSTAQVPSGMPLATVALGEVGAKNSAYLAMQILAIEDEELKVKLIEDRILKAKIVESDSIEVEVRV